MPQIFKALVTVTIWLMFIFAWIFSVFAVIIGGFVSGEFFGAAPPSMNFFAALAVSVGFAFAGGFLVLVRKRLE